MMSMKQVWRRSPWLFARGNDNIPPRQWFFSLCLAILLWQLRVHKLGMIACRYILSIKIDAWLLSVDIDQVALDASLWGRFGNTGGFEPLLLLNGCSLVMKRLFKQLSVAVPFIYERYKGILNVMLPLLFLLLIGLFKLFDQFLCFVAIVVCVNKFHQTFSLWSFLVPLVRRLRLCTWFCSFLLL